MTARDAGHTPPLRVLLYADLRSSHAQGWLDGLRAAGVAVTALSSETARTPGVLDTVDPISSLRERVVARGLNHRVRHRLAPTVGSAPPARHGIRVDPVQLVETLLAVARYPWQARALRRAVREHRPHLVHALRFPYEGAIALSAVRSVPVAATSWGQDFALQAASEPLLRRWLERVLPRLHGLCVDNDADVRLARAHGMGAVPVLEAAGNFGVDRTLFHPAQPEGPAVVVYPRGVRRYMRHQTFLEVARACRGRTDVVFVGVGLADDDAARQVQAEVGPQMLRLAGALPRAEFAQLLRSASVVMSPAVTDGTPNSLLEAIACGAYVIAGDVDGVRTVVSAVPQAVLLDPEDHPCWARHLDHVLAQGLHRLARTTNPPSLTAAQSRQANLTRVPAAYGRFVEFAARDRDAPHRTTGRKLSRRGHTLSDLRGPPTISNEGRR